MHDKCLGPKVNELKIHLRHKSCLISDMLRFNLIESHIDLPAMAAETQEPHHYGKPVMLAVLEGYKKSFERFFGTTCKAIT